MPYQKYRNTPTTVDNIRFASAAESRRYLELKMLLNAGLISDLELQPKFVIIPQYTNVKGKKIQAAYYIADFRYFDIRLAQRIIEDVKRPQTATAIYKLKKKLFEYRYPGEFICEVDA